MTDRRMLANAIRFLSIDAFRPLTRGIRAPRWVWQMLLKYYGVTCYGITHETPNGRTGIVLCCRMATAPC